MSEQNDSTECPSSMNSHDEPRQKAALAALTLLALIWGYNWVVMKIALFYAPPAAFGALRTAGAAVVLFAVLAALRKSMRMPTSLGRLILLGLFQTTGFIGLLNYALSEGDAGKTAILVFTMPFWVLLLAAPVLGERITGRKLLAGGFGFAGMLMIFSPWKMHGDLVGMALAVAVGLDWAIAVMIAKTVRLSGGWALLRLNAWQLLIGCIPLIILALAVRGPPIHWTGTFIVCLSYSVVLGTATAWFLWLFGLSRLSASLSGLLVLIVPVIGIVADWAQLGVRPGRWESIGAATVLLGLGLIAWTQRRDVA